MNKEERIDLINNHYDGDIYYYFFDQIREYAKIIPSNEKDLQSFRNCVEYTLKNVEEINQDELKRKNKSN